MSKNAEDFTETNRQEKTNSGIPYSQKTGPRAEHPTYHALALRGTPLLLYRNKPTEKKNLK